MPVDSVEARKTATGHSCGTLPTSLKRRQRIDNGQINERKKNETNTRTKARV